MCSERTRFSVSWKSLGDGVSRQEKDLFHRLLGETLPSMASSSRDPFTKYLEGYNW